MLESVLFIHNTWPQSVIRCSFFCCVGAWITTRTFTVLESLHISYKWRVLNGSHLNKIIISSSTNRIEVMFVISNQYHLLFRSPDGMSVKISQNRLLSIFYTLHNERGYQYLSNSKSIKLFLPFELPLFFGFTVLKFTSQNCSWFLYIF